MADKAVLSKPTGRAYGFALVTGIAAVMLAGSVVGMIAFLFTDGPWSSLALRLGLIALSWYWIGVEAWQRRSWSSRR